MFVVYENIYLSPKTTFKIGGNAKYFAPVSNVDEIKQAIHFARNNDLQIVILAGGSNILFTGDVDGIVLHIVNNEIFERKNKSSLELIVDAGVKLSDFVQYVAEKGYAGLENLYGIPGTVGGAIRGNAGAFGSEISDFIKEVTCINKNTLKIEVYTKEQINFEYRNSIFKQNPNLIILNAKFIFADKSNADYIVQKAKQILQEREKRHLQNVKAAGSFFKNPVAPQKIIEMFEKEKNTKSRGERVPAGWLIEKAGLKGARVGGAVSSVMHPNYILNENNATPEDVLQLAQKIKETIKQEFNVTLEEEVMII